MVEKFDVRKIKDPMFLKRLNDDEIQSLCDSIRTFIIDEVSQQGGHLSSNLGVVELTTIMHQVFDCPYDKFIFDVSHQCYTHKILTGRANQFDKLRQLNGLSGFTNRNESIYDCFEAGHSSTSLSAALGMAMARDINNEKYNVIALIGDGSIANGVSFEALNDIAVRKNKVIIILNDNNMSISANPKALQKTFNDLRISSTYTFFKKSTKQLLSKSSFGLSLKQSLIALRDSIKSKLLPNNIFTQLGIDYVGPIDGYDLKALRKALYVAKEKDHSIVIHVITKKGKGYLPAENDKEGYWHGVSAFNKETGTFLSNKKENEASFSKAVTDKLIQLASEDEKIIAITPAMLMGSELKEFNNRYPDRCLDAGIAEEHAAILAAGLATSDVKPYLFVYSTFMQRCYDQINHDICKQDLPVKLMLDRASLVGRDGPTHHGVFDISILTSLPNMSICQPSDYQETINMLDFINNYNHPIAMRFNRCTIVKNANINKEKIKLGTWTINKFDIKCPKAVIISYGNDIVKLNKIINDEKLPYWLVNARFIKPLDENMLKELAKLNVKMFTITEDVLINGLGYQILGFYNKNKINVPIKQYGIEDHYVSFGDINDLRKIEKIDLNFILKDIEAHLCD